MDEDMTTKAIDAAELLGQHETVKEFVSLVTRLRKDGVVGMTDDFLKRYLESLSDFDSKFVKAASDPEHFLSLSDIEALVMGLLENQRVLARELAWEKAKAIDEAPLIEKKKRELLEQEVKLRKWRKFPKKIMTLFGPLHIERTALIPATSDDGKKLFGLTGEKMVFPLDEALGLDRLPFKLSVAAMLEIAHWVQEIPSYGAASRAINLNFQLGRPFGQGEFRSN
jgi:hypothetical protein